ncbi:MAG: hypothetical protein JW839_03070 [Candidatus Lokiarchaeota archaeon]|nr:hypothetical protein [Candidatus Lokiarchaeota archaeon]
MLYEEKYFTGADRKPFLTSFLGTVGSIKKQASGNLIVVLARNKSEADEEIKREAIFKRTEIDTYQLEDLLQKGKSLAVFGVFTKRKSIFPVCFVKVKAGAEIKTIEFTESFPQYKVLLEHAEKAKQTELDRWRKG